MQWFLTIKMTAGDIRRSSSPLLMFVCKTVHRWIKILIGATGTGQILIHLWLRWTSVEDSSILVRMGVFFYFFWSLSLLAGRKKTCHLWRALDLDIQWLLAWALHSLLDFAEERRKGIPNGAYLCMWCGDWRNNLSQGFCQAKPPTCFARAPRSLILGMENPFGWRSIKA